MTFPARFLRVGACAGALLILSAAAGCATRGYQRAARTSNTMTSAADELVAAQNEIAAATAALDRLVNQPTQDLRPAFTEYRQAVGALENTVATLEQRATQMGERRQAYLTLWDQRNSEIQNTEIRDRSLERQQEVTQQFANVENGYQEARQSFMPLMSDLRDIQRLLGVDLTAAGVAAVRDLAANVRANSQAATQTLGRVAQQFRSVSSTLDPQTLAVAE